MSKAKLTDTEKLILERIKSYFDDQITLNRYEQELKILDNDNSNSIAQYGKERIKTSNVGSKIENYIIRKENIRYSIHVLQKRIAELDHAKNNLKKGQKTVVEEIMTGKKMTVIAKEMGKSKQQIYKLRKNALKNMQIF